VVAQPTVPTVRVRFWAGARRAAGTGETTAAAADIGALCELLSANPELAKVLEAASFLVDEVAATETTVLHDGAVVDVLPPFAGG
jgi:molybdopterin converting factor small subunit